jgi:hypothetical protein
MEEYLEKIQQHLDLLPEVQAARQLVLGAQSFSRKVGTPALVVVFENTTSLVEGIELGIGDLIERNAKRETNVFLCYNASNADTQLILDEQIWSFVGNYNHSEYGCSSKDEGILKRHASRQIFNLEPEVECSSMSGCPFCAGLRARYRYQPYTTRKAAKAGVTVLLDEPYIRRVKWGQAREVLQAAFPLLSLDDIKRELTSDVTLFQIKGYGFKRYCIARASYLLWHRLLPTYESPEIVAVYKELEKLNERERRQILTGLWIATGAAETTLYWENEDQSREAIRHPIVRDLSGHFAISRRVEEAWKYELGFLGALFIDAEALSGMIEVGSSFSRIEKWVELAHAGNVVLQQDKKLTRKTLAVQLGCTEGALNERLHRAGTGINHIRKTLRRC